MQQSREQHSRRPGGRLNDTTCSELTVGDGPGGPDFRALHAELVSYAGYVHKPVHTLPAHQLTEEAVRRCALREPLLVPYTPAAAAELGMVLPAEPLAPDRVALQLGPQYEVRTFDVANQVEGPHWTLHQWNLYWESRRPFSKGVLTALPPRLPQPVEDEADSAAVVRKRTAADSDITGQQLKGITFDCKKRLLQILNLPLAGTALEGQVQPPAAVRAADLLNQVWPPDAPYRPHTSAFLVMSPAGSYTDFRVAGGGSGLWFYVVSGAKSFALCPPSPRNLATYTAWATAAKHSAVFLPPHCEGVVRVDVSAGDTLLIPPGWIHASATTSAAVLVAGNFLLKDSLSTHLEAWRIEEHLGMHPRARYPLFKQLMWYTAAHYARALQQLAGLSQQMLGERVAQRLAEWAQEEEARAAAGPIAEQAAVRADSDSVMGTSKAGTTTQKRAGQPTSVRDDACNRPEAQPGLSAGNRSIIVHHKPLSCLVPAVNSKPRAVQAAPSAAAMAVARGEVRLTGNKRRRVHSPDSFIESDGEGSGKAAASDEHEWHPNAEDGSSAEEEEEVEEEQHNGSGVMDVDAHERVHSPTAVSPSGGRPKRLRAALEPGAQPLEMSVQGGRKTTTRFRGNLPPKLAAMLQTLSGEESPPHGSAGGSAGGQHSQHQHHHHHDTAATSAHKPIRLKVKLRPVEPQPATSGAPTSATGGGRTPVSGAPFSAASPRKLIVKISKAPVPRSPQLAALVKPLPHSSSHVAAGGYAAAAAGGYGAPTPPALPLPPSSQPHAVPSAQLQPQPPSVPAAIPQVDGAWDDQADNDSTVAVAPAVQQEQQQQRGEGSSDEEEVVQGGGGQAGGSAAEGAPQGDETNPQQQQPQQEQQQLQRSHAAVLQSAAVQDEFARMYAELEEEGQQHSAGGAAAPAALAQPAESGGSVGVAGARPQEPAAPAAAPAASTGAAPPRPAASGPQQQQQQQQIALGAAVATHPPQEPAGVSAAEAEGLAALVAVLRKWVSAVNALNDVPLSIKSPKEVLAGLEVCMQALGLPLTPPPPIDLEAVPLDRLRQRARQPGPAGTAATAGGSRRPRSLQTVQTSGYDVEAELETAEEGGDSMDADFNVVVEESSGPGLRVDVTAAGKLAAKGQQAARGGKKLSVKNRLMKKLHFK